MRGDVDLTQLGHEVLGVVALVGAECHPACPIGMGLHPIQGRQALGMARGAGGDRAHDQSVAVLHQRVPHERQLCFLAAAIAVQPCIGTGSGGGGVVAAALAVEVALAVAARARCAARPVPGLEAFWTAPGLDQRAVHREMLARQQPLDPGMGHHGGQKLHRDLARQQPVAVLGERRRIPYRVIDAGWQRNRFAKRPANAACKAVCMSNSRSGPIKLTADAFVIVPAAAFGLHSSHVRDGRRLMRPHSIRMRQSARGMRAAFANPTGCCAPALR